MTTKNLGPAVSGYLNPDGRAWETVVFQAGKPVLDKELVLGQDLDIGAGQSALTRMMPSGWLSSDYLDSSSYTDATYLLGGNPYEWLAPPMLAHVNGWLINVTNTGVTTNNRLILTAGPAGLGAKRTDLVILEVWRTLLSASPDVVGKSQTGRIWANGNVKVSAGDDPVIDFSDDILDVNVGSESTKRVQVQYRLRAIPNVDLLTYPTGIDDPTAVANSVPTDAFTPDGVATLFPYVNQSANGDPGLWLAGDGNPLNTLGTVDGYMYAIPLNAVFRRNETAFSKNLNQNGGVANPGPSDRPDGLFYDQFVEDDIADLRRGVRPEGWDYSEVTEKNVNLLLDNTAKGEWLLTPIGGGILGHTYLFANEIGVLPGDGVTTGDTPGAEFTAQFDGVRRFFSDRPIMEVVVVELTPDIPGNWLVGSTATIQPTAMVIPPYSAADFAARAPAEVMFLDILGAKWVGPLAGDVTAEATGNIAMITGLGTNPLTTVTITIGGTLPGGLTDEPLYVFLVVAYPSGNGITYTPTDDFGSASVSINNPLALPAVAPVSYSALAHSFDYPHREIELTYTTVMLTSSFAADTENFARSNFILTDRAASLVQVRKNGVAIVGAAILDSTGFFVTLTNALDYTDPGDTLDVDYIALRPLPNNGEQVTIWYNARAPQTVHNALLGTSITVVPRWISPHVYTMTVGSGSEDEAYPFPYQYVQTGGVYPTSLGTFDGEHEMIADATIDVSTFNADTGFLRLPIMMPYVPTPESVTFTRDPADIDSEGRAFFPSIVGGGYIPNAYAQGLSDAKKHKVILPMLVEMPTDTTVGHTGQLLLVYLQRWAVFDEQNSVVFDTDPTLNTTTASVFRVKGNLLNRR